MTFEKEPRAMRSRLKKRANPSEKSTAFFVRRQIAKDNDASINSMVRIWPRFYFQLHRYLLRNTPRFDGSKVAFYGHRY